jgi:hypothetical protein
MDELIKGIKEVLAELKKMNKAMSDIETTLIRIKDETIKTQGSKTFLKD